LGSVLLVSSSGDAAAALSIALDDSGHDLMICPGPHVPAYSCVYDKVGRCPLPEAVDVIVLDADLESDAAGQGTSSHELFGYYRTVGCPVIVLADAGRAADLYAGEAAVVLPRDSAPARIVDQIEDLIGVEPEVIDLRLGEITSMMPSAARPGTRH